MGRNDLLGAFGKRDSLVDEAEKRGSLVRAFAGKRGGLVGGFVGKRGGLVGGFVGKRADDPTADLINLGAQLGSAYLNPLGALTGAMSGGSGAGGGGASTGGLY